MTRWAIGLGLALAGCVSTVEPAAEGPPPADLRQQVARDLLAPPCPRWPEAVPLERDQVFVEMFVLDMPRHLAESVTLQNLEQLLTAPGVEALATPHVIADYDHEMVMGLEDWQGKTERATMHRLRVTPRHAEPGVTVLELELTLQLANPRAQLPNPTRSVAVIVPAREETPALSRVTWDEARQRSLLVIARPRAVRSQRDLKDIFECKMRRRHAALHPP